MIDTSYFESDHLMIDIETLGTSAHARVISVGACVFNIEGIQDSIQWNVLQDEDTPGKIDVNTVIWWMNQSEEAKRNAFDQNGATELSDVLGVLSDFYDDYSLKTVWSKGVTFDIIILQNMFKKMQRTVPWRHSQLRCMRSFNEIMKAFDIRVTESGVEHSAIHDATAQAKTVIKVWRHLLENEQKVNK